MAHGIAVARARARDRSAPDDRESDDRREHAESKKSLHVSVPFENDRSWWPPVRTSLESEYFATLTILTKVLSRGEQRRTKQGRSRNKGQKAKRSTNGGRSCAIRRGGWFAIVLQQGPSALPESRVNLIEFTRKFDNEAQRVRARTALYMVWPGLARPTAVEGVRQSYASAASAVS